MTINKLLYNTNDKKKWIGTISLIIYVLKNVKLS